MEEYISQAINLSIEYAPKLALAIVTLIVGLLVIGGIIKVLEKALVASKTDETLIPFLKSLTSWGLKLLLFISVASMIGIATTSFIAVLGAAGLAVGLALQGSLSNFAGGVLLLIFRPYKIGDKFLSQEFDQHKNEYTGKETLYEITYILRDAEMFGLKQGYCILSLKQIVDNN